MKTFRENYNDLETELDTTYLNLKDTKKEFKFLSDEDLEEGDFSELFDARNDITGNTFEVHIIQVDEFGIKIVESNDYNSIRYIGFNDLASVLDRINLIEMMQLYGI